MNNRDVMISSEYPLAATLTTPKEAKDTYPAVLIIAGSGKGDRDGNITRMKMNLYKDLAEFLTEKGFATLRYDKRGTHKSGGSFMETGLKNLIDDACACVKFLQNHPQIDKDQILILGHSEGALIAPAVHYRTPVSGLILLAGAAEPSIELIPRQNELAYKEIEETKGLKGWLYRKLNLTERSRKQNRKIFEKVAQSDQPVMRVKGIKLNAKWLRETMDYNVVDYLKEVECPVLAITGEKDLQVPPDHARKIAATVQGEAKWHIIPDMNHMLRKYEGQHTMLGLMKEYKTQIDQPIDKGLLTIIGNWIEKWTKGTGEYCI